MNAITKFQPAALPAFYARQCVFERPVCLRALQGQGRTVGGGDAPQKALCIEPKLAAIGPGPDPLCTPGSERAVGIVRRLACCVGIADATTVGLHNLPGSTRVEKPRVVG